MLTARLDWFCSEVGFGSRLCLAFRRPAGALIGEMAPYPGLVDRLHS